MALRSGSFPFMKIPCPNPSCCQHLSGPKSLMGRRFSCPTCGHSFIWTDCFHAGDAFVIYDLETTGLYPESDEFIQIAAVRMRAGCLCPADSFFSFARPRQRIPSFITSYTGITNDLERRLKMHQAGKASKYTRTRRPVEMLYSEIGRAHV